jgi:hypothetical protein
MLSAEELLAGSRLTVEVDVPAHVLTPMNGSGTEASPARVRLRPLTVADLQLISRAAKEEDQLTATLMLQRALVEPELGVAEVAALHVGLVEYLVARVNEISGIAVTSDDLGRWARDPLARSAHVLAREFGWTPQEVGDLTLGQVLLHLELLAEEAP